MPGLLKALDMDHLVEFHNRPLSMHGFSRELAPFLPLQPPTSEIQTVSQQVPSGPSQSLLSSSHPQGNHLLTPSTVGKFVPLKIGVIFIKVDVT